MEPIAQRFGVPLVPYPEWIAALQRAGGQSADAEKMRANPALRIFDFFSVVNLSPEREPLGIMHLDTMKSQRAAPVLGLPALGPEYATMWMDAWQRAGFTQH